MKVMVRGYGDGKLLFAELVQFEDQDFEAMAKSHIDRVQAYEKNMLELEFIDEAPNPYRFVRFGTDKRGMVKPKRII